METGQKYNIVYAILRGGMIISGCRAERRSITGQ